jgi:DNA invertase Pin-like site-specific DNA recombinase
LNRRPGQKVRQDFPMRQEILEDDSMPQAMLPFFPGGVTQISDALAFKKEEGRVVYFNYSMPVFIHDADDDATFRMITSQFCVNGNAKQAEIIRAFGVTPISVKRGVKKYRSGGPAAFYQTPKGRGASKLTADVIAEAQELLNSGESATDVATALGLKSNTIIKAIGQGKLVRPKKNPASASILKE